MTADDTWIDTLGFICLIFTVAITIVTFGVHYIKESIHSLPFPKVLSFCLTHTKPLKHEFDGIEKLQLVDESGRMSRSGTNATSPAEEPNQSLEHDIESASKTPSKIPVNEILCNVIDEREENKLKWHDFGDRLELSTKIGAALSLFIVLMWMFSRVNWGSAV